MLLTWGDRSLRTRDKDLEFSKIFFFLKEGGNLRGALGQESADRKGMGVVVSYPEKAPN